MGDKRNDYPNSSAQIFNRYGKLIITLTSSNHQWDGKYSGYYQQMIIGTV
jgi:gliding motility-associated-like protein